MPSRFARWNTFRSIELSREGKPRPGVSTDECLYDVEEQGLQIETVVRECNAVSGGARLSRAGEAYCLGEEDGQGVGGERMEDRKHVLYQKRG